MMGVTEHRGFKSRCRRTPRKLYNTFCYTYLTKDQPPPSTLVVYSTCNNALQYHRENNIMS